MVFLNDIGKKISESSQQAVKQTKTFSEITRLNGLISEKEKEIEKLYTQIGSAYYSVHKEDAEVCLEAQVRAVMEAYSVITQYKERIAELKGISLCPQCGTELPDGALFCSNCGVKVPMKVKESVSDVIYCTNCGKSMPKGQRFCNVCGAPLSAIEEGVKKPAVCPNCGKPVSDGLRFCTFCGTSMEMQMDTVQKAEREDV